MARVMRTERHKRLGSGLVGAADEADAPGVRGLSRGLELLSAFRADDCYLSNLELAERTNLPRSTVSRLCTTLMRMGYMTYSPVRGCYALGPGIVGLSRALLDNMANRFAASHILQALADKVHLPVSLGMPDTCEIVYIETARHRGARPARFDLGTRLPIETTAIGRAYFAGLSTEDAETLLSLLKAQSETSDWSKLERALEEARVAVESQGYCGVREEWRPDVVGLAAPVRLDDGTLLAINCGGTIAEVPESRARAEIGPLLAIAAAEIAKNASASSITRSKRLKS